MLFELLSYITGGERRRKAKALAKGEDPDGDATTLDVLQALEKFAPVHPDPEAFLECLEPLQPRLYSISSSPLATPGELHLTVDAVRYDIAERRRLGVASTFLADRLPVGAKVKVYLQKAHGFGLPADPKTPVIMVGPGTGIAPFRSFLWHRAAQKAKGKAWLFFGHQHEATDFFYRDELEGFLGNGTLAKLSTAWSRDGAQKVYVQDRMREAGVELWRWLAKEDAHFYVCGDAKRMAKDVEKAVLAVASAHGGLSEAEAQKFLADLKAGGRYQADVY
jgi:sulfite reductase (NADPH) flavoprotein alpha-component